MQAGHYRLIPKQGKQIYEAFLTITTDTKKGSSRTGDSPGLQL
jgi:hypothetical protein